MTPATDRSFFVGQQVAVVGRLSLLSKRDLRALVEQLGGTFSSDMTTRTTVVVTADTPEALPAHVERVLSEADLCRVAGLPDLDTLRSQYYAARDLRGMYPVLRDDHLRYLEKWGLVRPVAGRYSFTDLHVIKQAAQALERGTALSRLLRELASERDGQLSLEFQPTLGDRPPARVVSLPAAKEPEASLFPADRERPGGRDVDGTWRRAGDGVAEDRVTCPMTQLSRQWLAAACAGSPHVGVLAAALWRADSDLSSRTAERMRPVASATRMVSASPANSQPRSTAITGLT